MLNWQVICIPAILILEQLLIANHESYIFLLCSWYGIWSYINDVYPCIYYILMVWHAYTCIKAATHQATHLPHIQGLRQDCSNSSALAMELLQSCANPSKPCPMSKYRVSMVSNFAKMTMLWFQRHLPQAARLRNTSWTIFLKSMVLGHAYGNNSISGWIVSIGCIFCHI